MSYTINKTDGTVLTTILDGTTNTDTGLTLIGRNYTGYGTVQNENFVRLLENFADASPPGVSVGFTPIAGQLWWDTANQVLKVYTGTTFYPVNASISSSTAPTALNVGDQWWDTVNKQLNVWTGTTWYLVGPAQAAGQAKTGVYSEQLADYLGLPHTVVNTYLNGNVISVASSDTFNIVNPIFTSNLGLTTISEGLNIAATAQLTGTATNSLTLQGVSASQFARIDIGTTFAADVAFSSNIKLSGTNLSASGANLVVSNTNYGGATLFYNNTSTSGNIATLVVNGASGLITVAADPVSGLGIATKNYVDTNFSSVNSALVSNVSTLNTKIAQLRTDTDTNILSNIAQVSSTLQSSINSLIANQITTNQNIISNIATVNGTISGLSTSVSAISGAVTTNYSTLSGSISTTQDQITTANVAMKGYVDTQIATLTGQLTTLSSAAVGISGTANSYTDGRIAAVYAAIAANVGVINGTINTTQGQIVTANNAMLSYVITSNNALKAYVDNLIGPLASGLGGISLTGLAPIDNPTFTGTVTAPNPTTHAAEQVATTAWVDNEINNKVGVVGGQIQKIYIDSSAPSDSVGNDGDVWLQIG